MPGFNRLKQEIYIVTIILIPDQNKHSVWYKKTNFSHPLKIKNNLFSPASTKISEAENGVTITA